MCNNDEECEYSPTKAEDDDEDMKDDGQSALGFPCFEPAK